MGSTGKDFCCWSHFSLSFLSFLQVKSSWSSSAASSSSCWLFGLTASASAPSALFHLNCLCRPPPSEWRSPSSRKSSWNSRTKRKINVINVNTKLTFIRKYNTFSLILVEHCLHVGSFHLLTNLVLINVLFVTLFFLPIIFTVFLFIPTAYF